MRPKDASIIAVTKSAFEIGTKLHNYMIHKNLPSTLLLNERRRYYPVANSEGIDA